MDAVMLARMQFAANIAFHIRFPTLLAERHGWRGDDFRRKFTTVVAGPPFDGSLDWFDTPHVQPSDVWLLQQRIVHRRPRASVPKLAPDWHQNRAANKKVSRR